MAPTPNGTKRTHSTRLSASSMSPFGTPTNRYTPSRRADIDKIWKSWGKPEMTDSDIRDWVYNYCLSPLHSWVQSCYQNADYLAKMQTELSASVFDYLEKQLADGADNKARGHPVDEYNGYKLEWIDAMIAIVKESKDKHDHFKGTKRFRLYHYESAFQVLRHAYEDMEKSKAGVFGKLLLGTTSQVRDTSQLPKEQSATSDWTPKSSSKNTETLSPNSSPPSKRRRSVRRVRAHRIPSSSDDEPKSTSSSMAYQSQSTASSDEIPITPSDTDTDSHSYQNILTPGSSDKASVRKSPKEDTNSVETAIKTRLPSPQKLTPRITDQLFVHTVHIKMDEKAKLETEVLQLQSEKDEIKIQVGRFREENSNLVTENEQLKQDNSVLKKGNAQLEMENSSLKKENTDLKKSNSSLKTSNADLKKENSDLKKTNSELEKRNSDRRMESDRRDAVSEHIDNFVEEMEPKMEDLFRVYDDFTKGFDKIKGMKKED